MTDCKECAMPMDPGWKPTKDEVPNVVSATLYKQLVGCTIGRNP